MAAKKRKTARTGPKCKRIVTKTGKTVRRCFGPNGKFLPTPAKKRARKKR